MTGKRAATGLGIFLGVMWFCTLLSKSVYASKLPLVETEKAQERYIPHKIEAVGIVIEGGTKAVTVLPGIRVETVSVREGDQIKEGDLLLVAELSDLQELILEKQNAIEKLQLQISTIEQNRELEEKKKALEEKRAREDYDAISRLEDTDLGRAQESYAQAQQALEDFQNDPDTWAMDEDSRKEAEQALRDALQQAAYAEADAMRERDGAVQSAQRNVEDVLFPKNAEATLALYQAELEALQQELAPYKTLWDGGGKVFSDKEGMVSQLLTEPGSRISDGAVMYLTDETLPCMFQVSFDKEQKSYLSYGDLVTVKLDDGRQIEAELPYFSESKSVAGGFEVMLQLPENVGTPGLSGKLSVTKQGAKYPCCVSASSVYRADNKAYVYVLKEREGILGKEYYAEEVRVTLLDENESWAAIESVQPLEDAAIISYADREIKRGDVVRPLEMETADL